MTRQLTFTPRFHQWSELSNGWSVIPSILLNPTLDMQTVAEELREIQREGGAIVPQACDPMAERGQWEAVFAQVPKAE